MIACRHSFSAGALSWTRRPSGCGSLFAFETSLAEEKTSCICFCTACDFVVLEAASVNPITYITLSYINEMEAVLPAKLGFLCSHLHSSHLSVRHPAATLFSEATHLKIEAWRSKASKMRPKKTSDVWMMRK